MGALSKETPESLENLMVGDYVTLVSSGKKGKIIKTLPDSMLIHFPEDDLESIVEDMGDLNRDLSFRVGDKVEVVAGKLKGDTGIVTEIEYDISENRYTVTVDISDWGSYVHDSSYFRRSIGLEELKRLMDSGGMMTLEESLPGASKIIDDNFFDLI